MKYKLPVLYSKANASERRAIREQYATEQNGLCYWCKQPLTGDPPQYIKNKKINWRLFPPGFLRHPIHLQHNHSTDLTEGAVHARCNAYMWQEHKR
jgi:hypothetical protein